MTITTDNRVATHDILSFGAPGTTSAATSGAVGAFGVHVVGRTVKRANAPLSIAVAGQPEFRLQVERDRDVWVISDVPSGVFGTGETMTSALLDFTRATREHLDVLERQPALTPALHHQLEYLRARVTR
jgi:hypothetical protein